jgi:hypothetical protein
MDKGTTDMQAEAKQPQHKQDYENCPEHSIFPSFVLAYGSSALPRRHQMFEAIARSVFETEAKVALPESHLAQCSLGYI